MQLKDALAEYLRCVRDSGWERAESIKRRYSENFANFEKIADAAAILLRAEQIVQEKASKGSGVMELETCGK